MHSLGSVACVRIVIHFIDVAVVNLRYGFAVACFKKTKYVQTGLVNSTHVESAHLMSANGTIRQVNAV